MRLIDKFTIWFIVITSLVLIAGGLIVFKRVQYEIDREAIRRIKSHIDNTAKRLAEGKAPIELESEYLQITEIDRDAPRIELNVFDTMAVFMPRMVALDRKLTVESSYHIGGKHYRISMYDFVAEPDEIAECEPFLLRQIASIQPKVIVALGTFAAHALLKTDLPISRLRGTWQSFAAVELMTMSASTSAFSRSSNGTTTPSSSPAISAARSASTPKAPGSPCPTRCSPTPTS